MNDISTNLSNYPGLSDKQRATMSIHGLIVIVIGCTAGFAWVISLAGYLHVWPLPPFDMTVPDQKDLWGNAHTGPIMHGMLIILVAAIAPLMKLSKKEGRVMVIACIIEVWGNAVGFQAAPFTSNRGLTPSGPFVDLLSFGGFYVGVFAALTILYLAIVGCYRFIKSS